MRWLLSRYNYFLNLKLNSYFKATGPKRSTNNFERVLKIIYYSGSLKWTVKAGSILHSF